MNEQHENLQQKRGNLLTPSRVKLTMSITPPVGCVSNPRRPFPIPLKNPSTPSERAPKQNKFIKRKIALFFFQKETFVLRGRLNNQIQTFHIEIINTKSSLKKKHQSIIKIEGGSEVTVHIF